MDKSGVDVTIREEPDGVHDSLTLDWFKPHHQRLAWQRICDWLDGLFSLSLLFPLNTMYRCQARSYAQTLVGTAKRELSCHQFQLVRTGSSRIFQREYRLELVGSPMYSRQSVVHSVE